MTLPILCQVALELHYTVLYLWIAFHLLRFLQMLSEILETAPDQKYYLSEKSTTRLRASKAGKRTGGEKGSGGRESACDPARGSGHSAALSNYMREGEWGNHPDRRRDEKETPTRGTQNGESQKAVRTARGDMRHPGGHAPWSAWRNRSNSSA